MLGCGLKSRRTSHWSTARCGIALGFAICLAPMRVCLAQAPSTPVEWSNYRVSVTSKIAGDCRNAVSQSGVTQDAEARLRSAGIAVADVFNAQLAIDLDCVAVSSDPGVNPVAGYECLTFSEMVSVPSTDSSTLASTWRQCQPFKCGRAGCASAARSGLQSMFDGFVKDLWERSARASQALSKPESIPVPKLPDRRLAGAIFYSLYIMACLTLLVYWRFRRNVYR